MYRKIRKKSRSAKFTPNDRLMAEPMLSNSNFKVYVGDRWIKIKIFI